MPLHCVCNNVLKGTITVICVIPTLEMEIFGGIVVGTTVAYLHNHFFTELSFLNVYPVLKN